MSPKLYFSLIILVLLSSCKASKLAKTKDTKIQDFPYSLESNTIYKLADELREISGLSLSPDPNHLLAVQDENGIIFYLDKHTGEIIKKIDFNEDGDYEGICFAKDRCFLLKSSGTIYEFDLKDSELKLKKHKGLLNKETDHEGLTYDEVNQKFLVTCKDSEGLGEEHKNNRFVYQLDLEQKTKEVFFILSRREVVEYLNNTCSPEEIKNNHKKIFDSKRDYLHAGPSGICIHPLNGLIYMISSKGKYLFICNRNGDLKKVIKLDKKVLPQPEGIVIDEDGTMYISSENEEDQGGLIRVYPMLK